MYVCICVIVYIFARGATTKGYWAKIEMLSPSVCCLLYWLSINEFPGEFR